MRTACFGDPITRWNSTYSGPQAMVAGFRTYAGGCFIVRAERGEAVYIERVWGDKKAVSIDQAQTAMSALLPSDVHQIAAPALSADRQRITARFHSPALAQRWPAARFIGGAPGAILVLYRLVGERVISLVITPGNNP